MKKAENYDLINAAEQGDIDKVNSLINDGNSVNIFGGTRNDHIHQYEPEGMTPLHYAAKRGHENITRLLIDSGADIDFSDGFGRTPLHYAAYPYSSQKKRNDVESARMLIDAGANINAVDQDNKTCLRFAVEDSGNPEMVELLLANGVNKNIADIKGKTPSTIANEYGNYEILRML